MRLARWDRHPLARRPAAPRLPARARLPTSAATFTSMPSLPNLLLSLHPDYVMTHTLWPRGVDRTEIVCEWLFHPDAIAAPDFDPDDAVAFWDLTNRQDWHVCEQMQLGLDVTGLSARAVFPSRRTVVRLRPAHRRAGTKAVPQRSAKRRRLSPSVGSFAAASSPVAADRLDGALLESGRAGGFLGGIAGW